MARQTKKKRKTKTMTVSEQLRQAIKDGDQTRYSIAKEVKMDQGQLLRFVAGQSGVSLQRFDQLCEYMNLELRPK